MAANRRDHRDQHGRFLVAATRSGLEGGLPAFGAANLLSNARGL
jgi:hypothetical protein